MQDNLEKAGGKKRLFDGDKQNIEFLVNIKCRFSQGNKIFKVLPLEKKKCLLATIFVVILSMQKQRIYRA